MKKIILTLIIVLEVANSNAQKSCCMLASSTEAFAMLGSNKTFNASHDEPLPFVLNNGTGKMISYKTPDGKESNAYEINAENKTNVVFVIHEWWGLNDYIKQEAEKIAKETGARVIALDLYDNKVASVKDSASKYMQSVKKERAEAIIKGALNYVGTQTKVSTIGWCFGGGWSMQTALLAGKQSQACVMYYGMPEEDLNKLKTLYAPVLFVFAQKDQWINKEVVSKFEENIKKSGKKLTVKSYDADHAFANPSNPHFNKIFSEEAMNFIKSKL